jgi:WD40 repeat protein
VICYQHFLHYYYRLQVIFSSVLRLFYCFSKIGASKKGGNTVLKPSLRGSKNQRQPTSKDSAQCDLRAVQELQDSESAVTCIAFGQERLHLGFILLAAASKDGTVVIYRCPRTAMERQMFEQTPDAAQAVGSASLKKGTDNSEYSNMAVHVRLEGHTRAITSIFFNLLEDVIVTTSIDKQVRFWNVDTGEVVKVFTDSSPVPCGIFLPFNPKVFVAANSNAVLRLVNIDHGGILQKLKVRR